MSKQLSLYFLAIACFISLLGAAWASNDADTRTVIDMRGKEVQIPASITKVVTIDDGLVEEVMTILGESDKIVGLGSSSMQKSYEYTFTSVSSENYTYTDGMNPARFLNPGFTDLPLVQESSTGINYETLASLEPDVVIVRRGSCAASWGVNEEGLSKNIDSIEKLGIPTVVVNAPPCYNDPDLRKISEEIKIIGQVFDKEERAEAIAAYIESCVEMIGERTKDIPENEKPTVLALGLSPNSRSAGRGR